VVFFINKDKDNIMTKIAAAEFNKKVGYRLYLRRKISNLTQKNIAKYLNITFQCVQKYEKGQIALSLYNLYKLASLFNVDINYFLQDINKENETISKNNIQNIHLETLLKNFIKIKNKEIAHNIENLIYELSGEN
jgi:transcriptional regulator with XRE-family HTH domain